MDKTLKAIMQVEQETDCNQKDIDGFQFWNYERFYIWQSIEEIVKDEDTNNNSKIKEKASVAWKYIKYFFTKSSKPSRKNVDILFMPHPRRYLKDGKYHCMYSGELIEKYDNSLTLERFYEKSHLEPIAERNVVYLDRITILSSIYSLVCSKIRKRKNRQINELVAPYATYVYRAMGMNDEEVNAWTNRLIKKVVRDYYIYKIVMPYMRKILKMVSPKVVVEVVHYSKYCMMITEACHLLGIPVVELQHGYSGDNHTPINYGTSQTINQFPDYFLTFGDFHCRGAKFPIAKENVISTGFSYFEQRAHGIEYNANRKNCILFISHALIGQKMAKVAVELSNMLDMNKYRIIYKMHPVEFEIWRTLYPELVDSKIEIFDDFSKDIYDCFGMAYLQIGVSSTAIYEGLGVGMETLILKDEQSWWMNEIIEEGYAREISSADEIYNYINGAVEKTRIDKDYFFKTDATNNMVKMLNKIGKIECRGE